MTRRPARSLPLPKALRATALWVDLERAGLLDGLDRDARRARVALLEELIRGGVGIDEMRGADDEALALLLLERTLRPHGTYSMRTLAERAELDQDVLRRWLRALGMPERDVDEPMYDDDDLLLARRLGEYLRFGLPEDAMLTVARAIGRGAASIADAAGSMLGEALLQTEAGDGVSDPETALRYAAQTRSLAETDGMLLSRVLAANLAERIRSHAVALAEGTGARIQGAQECTVAFADLVGFTKLGEELSADELSLVAERLSAVTTDVLVAPTRLVKTIGDAVMLVSPEPLPVVRTGLALLAAAEHMQGASAGDRPPTSGPVLPPLRVGMASGIVVPHGGDWYGPPVNLASRITAVARPGTLVATQDVYRAADGPDLQWRVAGYRRFKGVRGAHRLYRLRP